MLVTPDRSFDTAPKPFLLKCSGGQDRTSFAAALYLIHRDGWSAMDAALAQFARFPYLHFPKTQQRWLKLFPDFARQDSGGAPLAPMDRAKLYAGKAQGLAGRARAWRGSYAAIFTAPTRSPRQW